MLASAVSDHTLGIMAELLAVLAVLAMLKFMGTAIRRRYYGDAFAALSMAMGTVLVVLVLHVPNLGSEADILSLAIVFGACFTVLSVLRVTRYTDKNQQALAFACDFSTALALSSILLSLYFRGGAPVVACEALFAAFFWLTMALALIAGCHQLWTRGPRRPTSGPLRPQYRLYGPQTHQGDEEVH
jgi:hypothetical protein